MMTDKIENGGVRKNKIKQVYCYFQGHDNLTDKVGWFKITCRRCGYDSPYIIFRRIRNIPYKIEKSLLWGANTIAKYRGWSGQYNPVYRHIEQSLKGVGTEYSCGAYSYEFIQSLLKQYEEDGLPEPLLSTLISEDGWISLEEHPEEIQPMLDDISKGVALLQTKEEQEELNRYDR